ncbi:ABC transporter ATP-binding protein [candidate division KSB1 bacterium]|nr:ABC transporter ATP-binding protein [candidate division KSB1 bacterium]
MSDQQQIIAHKITKPIQLLAAWLAGLVIVNATFLTAAGLVTIPAWLPALLTIAAVLNVPLFIVSLFLLQTKFRPEMLEDPFYARYLERKYTTTPPTPPRSPVDPERQKKLAKDIIKVSGSDPNKQEAVVSILRDSVVAQTAERFADSRTLSELYLYPQDWPLIYEHWREAAEFRSEFAELLLAGIVDVPDGVVREARLTDFGSAVAKKVESTDKLWNQRSINCYEHDNDVRQQRKANTPMPRTR